MSGIGIAQALGQRERQEDAADVLIDADGAPILLILADGMGGAAAGDVAASLIVKAASETFRAHPNVSLGSRLRLACDAANDALATSVAQEPKRAGMGGTLVAVAVDGLDIHFLSVGDSMLLRSRGYRLERLNADHSIGGALDRAVSKGLVPAEEAAVAAGRNRITSYLAGTSLELMRIDETVGAIRGRAGDLYILASDGLDTLSTDEIKAILRIADDPQMIADRLIEAVGERDDPYQDNTTVLVMRL